MNWLQNFHELQDRENRTMQEVVTSLHYVRDMTNGDIGHSWRMLAVRNPTRIIECVDGSVYLKVTEQKELFAVRVMRHDTRQQERIARVHQLPARYRNSAVGRQHAIDIMTS
jgi:hypothetical protein